MSKTNGTWLTRSQTANFLGLSLTQFDVRLRPKLPDGATKRDGRNLLCHGASVLEVYIEVYGRQHLPEDYVAAKTREKVAQANLRELQLAKEEERLCEVADVEKVWTAMAVPFRNATDELRKVFGDGAAMIWREAISKADGILNGLVREKGRSGDGS